ncbi:phenylalanine--tRNA ligase subunit beta [Acidithiobacillus sp. AMEEHan]|uniref:phenylalanine--tRNA ligase subunit beta n=1 Tax=Acidithiobacillus sp. AMEEHan TaxID=2994951 RepID=UPI0027E3F0D1|nr:phenylalanine--tRNA ligase subunit beta [Acidithiobacillus sp. AMEEHan]
MRVALEWLREYLDTERSAAELAEILSMIGLEVEAVEAAAADFSGVLVGRVLRVWAHPSADKLRVAEVDLGAGNHRQIVCGAANLREDMVVAAALPGARLPHMEIAEADLRGVRSAGMLCSAAELEIDDGSSGILELDADAPIGVDLRRYLRLDDPVFTLGLTPNRGDAFSILGVARDLAARGAGRFLAPTLPQAAWLPEPSSTQLTSAFSLRIADAALEACGSYSALQLEALPQRLPDRWRERLRRAGQKSIAPMVDWLNVWMLALGQPMHAFDAEKIQQGIEVRWARAGEVLDALDGRDLALDEDMLVIADAAGPVALAGIIGGRRTAVSAGTRLVLLEAAYFAARAVQGRARRLGLQTEAAQRYERGVDFRLALPAALALAEQCGVRCVAGATVSGTEPRLSEIRLRPQRIARVLGTEIAAETIFRQLQALGCQIRADGSEYLVLPPSHRYDLRIEADLIEELGRLTGYEHLPTLRPHAILRPLHSADGHRRALMALLSARGYSEIISYSFIAPELQARFYPGVESPVLQNPISADMAVMRAGIWPGLLQTLSFNRNRQQDRQRFFEIGRVFTDQTQRLQMAGAMLGAAKADSWLGKGRASDFFDLKGDVEALLGVWPQRCFHFAKVADPALHPGQSAEIFWGERVVGRLGALHPALAESYDVTEPVWLFALDLELLLEPSELPRFQSLSPFPSVRRDLALLVPEELTAGDVLAVLRGAESPLLQEVSVFDRYIGKSLADGQVGLGVRLQFQGQTSTLTEAQVQEEVDRLLQALQQVAPIALRN